MIKCKRIAHLTCTFPTLVQIYNILYLDLPLFPRSWPTIVLFTVALTEAHLGAVQTQSHANLLVPFWSFFIFLPIPFPTRPSTSLTLCLIWCNYVPVDGNVKYLTHFVVRGTILFSRWAISARTPMYANLHTKQAWMFSI